MMAVTWKKLVFSDELTAYLPLAGGTLTGDLIVVLEHALSSTIANKNVIAGTITNQGSGIITSAIGSSMGIFNTGAGSIVSGIGYYVSGLEGTTQYAFRAISNTSATGTNKYGLYFGNISGAATGNYAIYTNAGLVRLGDSVDIVGYISAIQTNTATSNTTGSTITAVAKNNTSVGSSYVRGISGTASLQALTDNAKTVILAGLQFSLSLIATSPYTASVTARASGIEVWSPSISGTGTISIPEINGLRINNPGNASIPTANGIYLESISGSTANYAIRTGAGASILGDKLTITGSQDAVQLTVTANGAQGTDLVRFGSTTNYAAFEADGTLKLVGNATGWKDIFFPQSPPKATGAGNPTLVALVGNLRGYAYAVNDIHDFDPQEFPHDGKVSSTITWHVHWYSMTNVAATRGVKWEIEYTWANQNAAINATTTSSIEVTVAANTAVGYQHLTDIVTQTPSGIGPATMLHVRLKRIAAAGTAPATDPIVSGVHAHYEVDTPAGSRTITTK